MIKTNFGDFPLSEELLKAIHLLNFEKPTKVQEQVIPAILEQKDVIVKSQTGSGKTAAFAIPICQSVNWDENLPQALIITPTRELAFQIKVDFFHIGRFKRLKVTALFGKSPFYLQEKELKQKTHVVVGTPGRIFDHLDRGTFDPSQIKYLVIDEADEMLRMGFVDQVERILGVLPEARVTIVLSATIPSDISALCNQYMKEPLQVSIEEPDPVADRILQTRFDVSEDQKLQLLKDLVIVENPDSCMIFCNTQLKVDEVYHELNNQGFTCDKIHGGMEQRDRLKVMEQFKRGYFRYLVATDVAARGIDIDQIGLVINFDVPNNCEGYVHRIGRTGRIGHMGKAMTFVAPSEHKLLEDIHQFIGNVIPLSERPNQETLLEAEEEFSKKLNAMPELKESKGVKLSEGIMKLHINAGKKTKMRAVDIVGTLCGIEGMTAADIGIINILDISTFVEILNHKGEFVYQELQERPIKGRLRKVSKANPIGV